MNIHILILLKMSIDPAGRYEAVTFQYPLDNIVWTVQGPLSGDLVAGILTGILVVTQYLAKTYGINPNDVSVDVLGDEKLKGTRGGILDTYQGAHLPHYDKYLVKPRQIFGDNFSWWIHHPKEDLNIQYMFGTPEFIQGFISIIQGFGLDFRQFVVGPPYKYSIRDTEPTFYNIDNYDIEPFPEPKRGAPVGAFYTAEHEADPGGEDYE